MPEACCATSTAPTGRRLSEVRRFTHADGSTNHAEAAASLVIRRGDPAGLGYYLDHGRIHVGDDTTTADQAFTAWTADRAAGLNTLLITSTDEQVRELNLRTQATRSAAAADPSQHRVTLADGTTVRDGDVIITRRNDRRLTLSATDWVANGDRWTVTLVRPDGVLDVRHSQSRRRVTLPADYAAQHVQLGYACTVHAAQGQTVDTCHTVLTGSESGQLLYVALTRGRHANDLYLDVSVSADDAALHTDAIRPFGPESLAQIEARADATVPGITDCPAWPVLSAQLQRVVLAGADADQVLRDEAMLVRRDRASDLAAILASRLEANQRETGPLPWLPPVPRQLAEDDFWGRYFDRRHELIERHGTAVRAAATSWTQETAPAWAVPTLSDPNLTRDLAITAHLSGAWVASSRSRPLSGRRWWTPRIRSDRAHPERAGAARAGEPFQVTVRGRSQPAQRQAAAVRSIAKELVDAGESVVVLGDLNEGPGTAGEPPTNLATLFDPAGPLRSCYDLPGFAVGPRLGTFDSCGMSNRLDHIFISADLPPRFRGGSVFPTGLWGSRKTRPTAWDEYPDITTGTQQAFDHSALFVRLNVQTPSHQRVGLLRFDGPGRCARSGCLLDGFVELVGCQVGDVAAGCAHTRRVPPPAITFGAQTTL